MVQDHEQDEKQSDSPFVEEDIKQGATPITDLPDGYNPVEISHFKFETPGDAIAGRLIAKTIVTIGGNRVGKYTIRESDGSRTSFLGTVTLDDQLNTVSVGKDIYIKYTRDDELEGGKRLKRFSVGWQDIQGPSY